MTQPPTDTGAHHQDHDDARDAVRAEFSSRHQALLDAWDRDNRPSHITDAFVEQLLAAYDAAEHPSIHELEAADEALCAEMAAAAEAESKGDAGEFREITAQHEAHLYRMALRLSGDREAAKDLAQETLTRAWSRFGQFERGTNARAWLVTILTRLYLDGAKHARVVSRAEPALDAAARVDDDALPSIADRELWAAVDALEPELRGLVVRCYLQQKSYKAIADELQLPIGTIGTRLMRARARLRTLLAR
jgi:RNA polymerase sigma-70 factor (ECF subfamily)